MEIARDQPINILDKHHTQTQSIRILTYLLITTGIWLSVWLIQSHKAVRLASPPTDPASKTGLGWSLDLTDREL